MLQRIATVALTYLAWIVSSLIGLYAMLKWWEAGLMAYVLLDLSRWGYGAWHHFSILILGLVYLAAILFIEDHYTSGLEKGLLPRRVLRVTLIQVVIVAGALVALGLM